MKHLGQKYNHKRNDSKDVDVTFKREINTNT